MRDEQRKNFLADLCWGGAAALCTGVVYLLDETAAPAWIIGLAGASALLAPLYLARWRGWMP